MVACGTSPQWGKLAWARVTAEALVRGPRRTASVMRRALAMVLAVAVGTIGLALVPESAQAAVEQ